MEPQQPLQPAPARLPVYDAAKMAEMHRITELMDAVRRMKNGANTFYWIAGLSVINSLISIFGGGVYFVIGLGVTLAIDSIATGISQELGGSPIVLGMGFLFSLIFDLIFVAFGYFAGKAHRWAFIVGMILYGLDALLMLAFQEWIGFGFHLYFMWGVWQGFAALNKLKTLESANPMAIPPADAMR